jgi:hypothetical protein
MCLSLAADIVLMFIRVHVGVSWNALHRLLKHIET